MRKIPTVFVRDEATNRKHVKNEVTPGCEWVLAGEGIATRKYDGTCFMFDGENWWARREIKPGKKAPDNFMETEHDETTGKTVGYEPADQSGFYQWFKEALDAEWWLPYAGAGVGATYPIPGTYELVGPKINGNPEPEKAQQHALVKHGYEAAVERDIIASVPRDFEGLRAWLQQTEWEGIVWHHPDGRMAKLKRRDFPTENSDGGHVDGC